MAALPPYVPTRDANFANWLSNFSTLLTASPALYGLTALDAANVAGVEAAFAAAYALVTSPATRTPDAVQAKNVARINAQGVVRPLAVQISLNAGVLASDKVAVGVNPRTSVSSPITAPTSNPQLFLQSASNLSAILRYRDSAASVSVKSKPYGVLAVEVRSIVAATVITDPNLMFPRVLATKSPFVITFNPGDAGKICTLIGRYVVRSGGVSPWSPVVSFTVLASQ